MRDTLRLRILKELQEGPGTSMEISAALDHPYNATTAILADMHKEKMIGIFKVVRGNNGRPKNMYCVLEQVPNK